MSLRSIASASASYSGGVEVARFFSLRHDHTFTIVDVLSYGLNVGGPTSRAVINCNEKPLLWALPTSWLWGAAHAVQLGIAKLFVGHRNEHWFLLMHDITSEQFFVLEYTQQGVEIFF
eukprot:PhF_6_TR10536/c0_g1_i1/m.16636